jgi:phage shock protein PspC (stress-responsive transcriptional regulator)
MNDEAPRRLVRPHGGRVVGGVCEGLGRYFHVDPAIFRIGALVLVFIGGTGVLAYVAAWVILPPDDADRDMPAARSGWAMVAVVLACLIIGLPLFMGMVFTFGGVVLLAALAVVAGVLAWWLATGEGPAGTPGEVVKRAVFGLIVIAACGAVAFLGAWAAAAGGTTFVAIAVMLAGAAVLAGAFLRPVRWLAPPAVVLALSAGVVSAAGVDLDGGVGDRSYRPTSTAELRETYQLGAGDLTLDLLALKLPPGETRVRLDLGVGTARVVLHDSEACVGLTGDVGIGEARLYQRKSSGVDVDFSELPTASASTPRLVIEGDVGVGSLQVEGEGVGGGRFDSNRRCDRGGERAQR